MYNNAVEYVENTPQFKRILGERIDDEKMKKSNKVFQILFNFYTYFE